MATKKIKTVIIGLGRIAHGYEFDAMALFGMKYATHLSALAHHKGFELVAGSDISEDSRSSFNVAAKKYKLEITVYSDWEKMVTETKPDLVVVATNTDSHAKICNKLIDMGIKNILCEKPVAGTLAEAEMLVAKADKNGCNLFVNYFRAFNPSYIELVDKIKSGFLGKIQTFDVKYTRGLLNNGTHFIDLLMRMFGEVSTVSGFRTPTAEDFGKDPTLSARIQFKNGVSGVIYGMNNNFYNILELDILGELGRVRIVNERAELYLPHMHNTVAGYTSLKLQPNKGLTSIKDGLYPVYDSIYNKKNRCSGLDSLNSLRVADKIVKSFNKYEK
ncbi:MAG: Gfo/Idh/MocA family oxidoreductase [bacterium]|nr:Gfo/Idh/MocA family oxidoreductase [bacterium]